MSRPKCVSKPPSRLSMNRKVLIPLGLLLLSVILVGVYLVATRPTWVNPPVSEVVQVSAEGTTATHIFGNFTPAQRGQASMRIEVKLPLCEPGRRVRVRIRTIHSSSVRRELPPSSLLPQLEDISVTNPATNDWLIEGTCTEKEGHEFLGYLDFPRSTVTTAVGDGKHAFQMGLV